MFDNRPTPPENLPAPGNITRHYLEQLQDLHRLGLDNQSPQVQAIFEEIAGLPKEQTARLRSMLNLREQFQDAVTRVHQEMDPLEDPARFQHRLVEYCEKLLTAAARDAE